MILLALDEEACLPASNRFIPVGVYAKTRDRRQARDIDRVDGLNSKDEAGPALTLKTGRQPQKRNFFSPNGKVVDSGAVIEVDASRSSWHPTEASKVILSKWCVRR